MIKIEFLIIDQDNSGRRLDNFIFSKYKKVPKSKIYSSIRKAKIKVNGKKSKPDYKLCEKDKISCPAFVEKKSVNDSPNISRHLELIENSIIYDSKNFIVINKPPNFAVHGGSGLNFGVIELIKKIYKYSDDYKLAHRIDKFTSGCLIIAKKMSSLRDVHAQFRTKQVKKVYECIVHGQWPKSKTKIESNIEVRKLNNQRFSVESEAGKTSHTKFKFIKCNDLFSHIVALPITGRTHQIRLHCSGAGHPIVGDNKYKLSKYHETKSRMMLHAKEINFIDGGKKIKVIAKENYGFGLNKLTNS